MQKISSVLTKFFIKANLLEVNSLELLEAYEYIIYKKISSILFFSTVIVCSIITKTFLEACSIVIAFISFRKIAGGTHLKSSLACFLISIGAIAAEVLLMYYIPIVYYLRLAIALFLINIFIFILYAPAIYKNDWHSLKTKNMMRKKTLFYSFMLIFISIVFIKIHFYINPFYLPIIYTLLFSTSLGSNLCAISVVICMLENKKQKKDYTYEN